MAKSRTNLGLVDLSSYLADQLADQFADLPDQVADLPHTSGILWPRVELTWVWLTSVHIWQIS